MLKTLKGAISIDVILNQLTDFWLLLVDSAKSFMLKDIIDIAIVTFLIYGAINLLRETRAGQLVKGLILIISLYLISTLLGLNVLNTTITFFFQYTVIAILIVFQPEIRKALEQMGRSNIVSVVGPKESENLVVANRRAISCSIDALMTLQKLKMGAIIVFERKTKLGDIIETGTLIDASPSAQIITNIFFNKAPLHDGAMIIRNGKVTSAGCILPLTKNDALSSHLGTRHRAGLGLSEESDAVVLILSEETSQISVAENGILKRNLTKDELSTLLDTQLISNTDDSDSLLSGTRTLFIKKRGEKSE